MRKFNAMLIMAFVVMNIVIGRFYFDDGTAVVNVENFGNSDEEVQAKLYMLDGSYFFVSQSQEIEDMTKDWFIFDIPQNLEGWAKLVVQNDDYTDWQYVYFS